MNYKSPLKKLVQFFQESRDNWKKKAQAAKQALKLARNRIRFLEESKAKLKAEVNRLKTQLLVSQSKKLARREPIKEMALKKMS